MQIAEQVPTISKSDRINKVLSMVSPREYDEMTRVLGGMFDLEYRTVDTHPNNIKAIIKYKTFTFRQGISAPSKAFMVLHSLGHYFFISSAKSKKNDRYEYIYDKEGREAAALHLYEKLGEDPREVTEKMRKDRIEFEVGANNFAIDLLKHVKMSHLSQVVSVYQPGDVNYILDVTAGGKDAIVKTDHDYLDKYICAGLSYEREPNDENIHEPGKFKVGDADWPYLDHLKLEVHFF